MMLKELKHDLAQLHDPEKAKQLARFFKTGKGQYGERDIFLGIPVPKQRKIAKRYSELPLTELQALLRSGIHEHRLTALLILVAQYEKADKLRKDELFQFYLNNIEMINNWDLVDISAPKIIGKHLLDKEKELLFKLTESTNVWERRIAILSTFTFIRNNKFHDALKIAELLVYDTQDLIHKAVGWMLREIGKRDQETEEQFLRKYAPTMPRTMLRYAIEKFDQEKRRFFLTQIIHSKQ